MTCHEAAPLLSAYLDRELDQMKSREVAAHLEQCADCRRASEALGALHSALQAHLTPYRTPDILRARIEQAVRTAQRTRAPLAARRWRLAAIAASALFVLSVGAGVALSRGRMSANEVLATEILSSHVRSLMPGHLTDVESNNLHNVKPWFDGRLDFSPAVYDLDSAGFPLRGGRLDYVGGRPVAALVYGRRLHVINVYEWPAAGAVGGTSESTRNGYHLIGWTQGGMVFRAVSDVSLPDLREFVRLMRAAGS